MNANELAYTGGVYDQATEMYYLNARFYSSEEGRFLSMDTYRGDSKEYATWNLYGYCGGDPVNYVDPSGHWPVSYEQSKKNYKYNRKHDFVGYYVPGQKNSHVSKMKYGNTTVGKMGCVPIATFNALYYLGAMKCLSDVILAFETVKATDKTRGTNQYFIPFALKMLKLNYKYIGDKTKAMNALKKHHSMILGYGLFGGGGHAVFINAHGKDKLRVWNEYTTDNKKTTYDYKKLRVNKFVSNMLTFQYAYQLKE